MVERNMIREGFIRNTPVSTDNPTFSGSQAANESQLAALADQNTSVAAITVSATENIDLTADLGARWKLDRLELHTNELTIGNVIMEVSDNNVDFYGVTLTGSPNLYVGDIPDSTVSGAPRYIRYRHAVSTATDVFEWKAINDDTIVDFGVSGNQSQAEIADAPIGRPSDQGTELRLFNRYPKAGTASVFVDNTGADADELIEVATADTGPWFGRALSSTVQPDNTPFVSGTLDSTQVVPARGYFVDYVNSSVSRGWQGDNGASGAIVANGVALDSNNTTQPRWSNFGLYTGISGSDVGGDTNPAGPGSYIIHQDHLAIRPDWYDRVRVRMIGPQISTDDFLEGPRLYWRGIDSADTPTWSGSESTLSQFPFNNFTGEAQDFVFNVGDVPTWSGAALIRGMSIQPFTSVSGLGAKTTIQEIEVYHSSNKERVMLELMPTISGASGQRPSLVDAPDDNFGGARNLIAMTTRVTQPCIITKVSILSFRGSGVFLARFDEDNPDFAFPQSDGTNKNFIVKNVVNFDSSPTSNTPIRQLYVRWKAEPGDFLGTGGITASNLSTQYTSTSAAGYASAWTNNDQTGLDFTDASTAQTSLNGKDEPWQREDDRLYQIWFESVSAGPYIATGKYVTPIFEGNTLPALLSASFASIEEGGSSIDSNISEAFKTIKVRASDKPPKISPDLGQAVVGDNPQEDTYPAPWWKEFSSSADPNDRLLVPSWLNELSDGQQNDWQINFRNGPVSSREGADIQNVAASLMYHPEKDELWALNVLLSGTAPDDLRPIWDVYNPCNFDFVRTQHLTGQISYAFDSGNSSLPEVFEPAGFVYDENNEEIYIFSREDSFFIGTAQYRAVVMDLEGNFKRLAYRGDVVTGDEDFLLSTVSVAFDGTYFYHLTTANHPGGSNPNQGSHIAIYKLGTAANPQAISFIDSFSISSITGFSQLNDNDPDAQQIVWNPEDGLLYVMFANKIDGSDGEVDREHELHAIRVNFTTSGDSVDTLEKVELSGIENSNGGIRVRSLDVLRDGFLMEEESESSIISPRDLSHSAGMVYIPNRDMFVYLQNRFAQWFTDYNPRTNDVDGGIGIYDRASHSFMLGIAADTSPSFGGKPTPLRKTDAIWGTLSGTLSYETVQPNSVLFPPGRYGQLEYTLNAGTGGNISPQLLGSQLDQGINVGQIPASGTISIYLRTNLPEDQTIGDQQGRLKVFWELPE